LPRRSQDACPNNVSASRDESFLRNLVDSSSCNPGVQVVRIEANELADLAEGDATFIHKPSDEPGRNTQPDRNLAYVEPEAVNLGLPVCSGFCVDGGFVDPGLAGWAGSDGWPVSESGWVFGEDSVEDVLALDDDVVMCAVVDVDGMQIANA